MQSIAISRVTDIPEQPESGQVYFVHQEPKRMNVMLPNNDGSRMAVMRRTVCLSGNRRIQISTTDAPNVVQYYIQNFDRYTTYQVSSSAGDVELPGPGGDPDIIVLTAPTEPGPLYLTVNGETSKIDVYDPNAVDLPVFPFPSYATMTNTAILHQTGQVSLADQPQFGGTVVMTQDGTTAFVASLDIANGNRNNKIYVFTRTSGSTQWNYSQCLEVLTLFQELGYAMAVSGNGNYFVASNADASYLFFWRKDTTTGQWTGCSPDTSTTFYGSEYYLNDPKGMFGYSLSISDDGGAVAVSTSTTNSVNPAPVRVLTVDWSTGQVTAVEELPYPRIRDNSEGNGQFGEKVTLSGDGLRLAADSGDREVIVYEKVNGTWTHTVTLGGMTSAYNGSGVQLDKSGTLMLFGGSIWSPDYNDQFIVVMERKQQGEWVELQRIYKPDDGYTWSMYNPFSFGNNFRMNSTATVLVAASPNIATNGVSHGVAYLYIREGKSWVFKQRFDPTEYDFSGDVVHSFGTSYWSQGFPGQSIAVSDEADQFMIGDFNATVDGKDAQGAVYVFTRVF